MHRITISVDDPLAEAFDALTAEQGYASRSEAVRDLVRAAVDARTVDAGEEGDCVANLSYVYDHHVRALGQRLLDIAHAYHGLIVSTTHVHLDHQGCLESVMMRGPVKDVRALADQIRAERGVQFGALNLISEAAARGINGEPRHPEIIEIPARAPRLASRGAHDHLIGAKPGSVANGKMR